MSLYIKKIVEKKCNIKAVIICEKRGYLQDLKEYKSIMRYGLLKEYLKYYYLFTCFV